MKKFFVTALLMTGLVAGSANAAVISGSLNTSPTDADVFNTDVIGAINVGSSTGTGAGVAAGVTVNSVDFVAAGTAGAAFDNTIGNASVGQLNVAALDTAAFSTFDASSVAGSIDTVLSSIMIAESVSTNFPFVFTDLQIGTAYTLQVFLASAGQPGRGAEFTQGGSSLLIWDASDSGPSIATFTFTADQATETLLLNDDGLEGSANNQPIMSGYVFAGTPIPEPSSVCLTALGLLGMIGFGRRRK